MSTFGPRPSELFGPSRDVGEKQCSRKGCREAASWALLWNNPRIHTPARRKVWLACEDHREWFEEYLSSRGLWKQTVSVDNIPEDAG